MQTTNRPWSSVVPIGYHPPTTSRENRHRTNAAERYFGHENVALYTHGGVVPAGDPDAGLRVPPRLCVTSDLQTRVYDYSSGQGVVSGTKHFSQRGS